MGHERSRHGIEALVTAPPYADFLDENKRGLRKFIAIIQSRNLSQ